MTDPTYYGCPFLGNYYAAVSCYNGARTRVNFGPDFEGRMPEEWEGVRVQPLSDLETVLVSEEKEEVVEEGVETRHPSSSTYLPPAATPNSL